MMIVFVAILPLLGSAESDSNHGKENEVVHQQYDYKRPDFDLSQLKVRKALGVSEKEKPLLLKIPTLM